MTQLTRRSTLAAMAGALTLPVLGAAPAAAQTTHIVEMLNRNPDDSSQRMVFSPPVLRVAPGDTVRFVPTDRGHNAQSIESMTPAGGETFRGRNNQEVEVTFTVEGTYGYICQPHQTMGMIGFILVGDHSTNFADVVAAAGDLRGRTTQERATGYLTEIEAGIH